MKDVVDTLFNCDIDVNLSYSEQRGLDTILELAKDIVEMEDKIENILSNEHFRNNR